VQYMEAMQSLCSSIPLRKFLTAPAYEKVSRVSCDSKLTFFQLKIPRCRYVFSAVPNSLLTVMIETK
jgi:hypothetical protein